MGEVLELMYRGYATPFVETLDEEDAENDDAEVITDREDDMLLVDIGNGVGAAGAAGLLDEAATNERGAGMGAIDNTGTDIRLDGGELCPPFSRGVWACGIMTVGVAVLLPIVEELGVYDGLSVV